MKLADALVLRADVQKRIEQLRNRLRQSALMQVGETPPENPQELLAEAERPTTQLARLVARINRANLARVFGELLYLLEYRDKSVTLPYSRKPFSLPPNLYFIGTMNTADRSLCGRATATAGVREMGWAGGGAERAPSVRVRRGAVETKPTGHVTVLQKRFRSVW